MTIGSQKPELDWGLSCPTPPYKLGSQNTPYKLRLTLTITHSVLHFKMFDYQAKI